jgi:hypothetical protein
LAISELHEILLRSVNGHCGTEHYGNKQWRESSFAKLSVEQVQDLDTVYSLLSLEYNLLSSAVSIETDIRKVGMESSCPVAGNMRGAGTGSSGPSSNSKGT